MSEQDPVERARQVEHVYKNPIFQEFVGQTSGKFYAQWLATEPGDVTGREWLWAKAHALGDLCDEFEAGTADLERFNAEKEIAAEEAARERASEGE